MNSLYAAACAMVRNEPDLREWVAYHLAVGFEHLLIYDNESVQPAQTIVRDFIAKGLVTVLPIRGSKKQCSEVYVDVLRRSSGQVRWMAFIDADEFILPHTTNDIREYLSRYEQFSAIGINWQVFGDNDHVSRPIGLLMEHYTKRGPVDYCENRHVKPILNPSAAVKPCNPHCFYLASDEVMVDSDGIPIPLHSQHHQAFCSPPKVTTAQINHYFTRSLEDFSRKKAQGGGNGIRRRDALFADVHLHCNQIQDQRIQRFMPRVQAALSATRAINASTNA